MANVIPLWMKYADHQLDQLDINQANRWLKSELAKNGFDRVMFGSADISLEDGYYQLHWHIAIWTSNPARLTKRLKQIFPSEEDYDRPVLLKRTYDLNSCRTKTKASSYLISYAETKKAWRTLCWPSTGLIRWL